MSNVYEEAERFWARVHEYLGQGDDHQRGYYQGLCKMLFYSQAQVAKGVMTVQFELTDLGYGYSPGGEVRHAAHFWGREPAPPPDMVWHQFDPCYLHCMFAELDSEGRIYALHQSLVPTKFSTYLQARVACSEDAEGPGVPEDFPGNTWGELETMRDRIRELDKWNTPERKM